MLQIVVFSLLIVFQVVVTIDLPPPKCRVAPSGVTNPEKCCEFPKIFKVEDLKECGIETLFYEGKVSGSGPSDCSKATCLLKKNNLMKDDEVDMDAVNEFLKKSVEDNPDYKVGIEKAKEICIKSNASHSCTPHSILFCMKQVIFMECPKWEDSDNCKKLKDYIDECKQYFLQH